MFGDPHLSRWPANLYAALLRILAALALALAVSNSSGAQSDQLLPANSFADTTSHGLRVIGLGEREVRNLSDHGISLHGQVILDWSKSNAEDDSGGGFGRYVLDLMIPINGEKLWGLAGSTAELRVRQHMREFGDDYVGAAQLCSNIDGAQRSTLYEAWIEQRLLADKIRLKAGKIDANSEFAVVQNGADFLNSSMGYSPTIVAFPTYPEPKGGFGAFFHPGANLALSMGVFRTAGMGVLSIAEPGYSWNLGSSEHPGRAILGYWRLDGAVPHLDGTNSPNTQGFYAVAEQTMWAQLGAGNKGKRALSGFIQFGRADGQVSLITHHAGAGGVLQGPFAKRSQDAVGLAATWVRFTSQSEPGISSQGELVIETYYRANVVRHVTLVPDIQFVHQPSGFGDLDRPVFTQRLVVSF